MTKGNISKVLIQFTVPLVISSLMQQLYSIADAVIVGNFVGEQAVAAIGVTTCIVNLMINIVVGFTVGINVYIARLAGEGRRIEIGEAVYTSYFYLFPFALALALIGVFGNRTVLGWMHTDVTILGMASGYITVTSIGLPCVMLFNIASASLRGIGDSRTPMKVILMTTVINVVLDYVFVTQFHLGLLGTAYATVIAQFLSAAVINLYLFLRVMTKYRGGKLFSRTALAFQLGLGTPGMIQSGILSVGQLFLQGIMNQLGIQAVAAITSAYRIDSMIMLPTVSMGTALSTFTAQNIGAKEHERVKKGFFTGVKLILPLTVLISVIVIIGGKFFIGLFGVSEATAALGHRFFKICAVFYPVFALENCFIGFLQGNSDTVTPAVCSVLGLFIRIGISASLIGRVGFPIVPLSEMVSWLFIACACGIRAGKVFKRCNL